VAHDLVEEGLNPHTKAGNEIWARVPAKVPAVGFLGEQPGVVKSSGMSGEPGRTRTCNPLIKSSIRAFWKNLQGIACTENTKLEWTFMLLSASAS